MENTAEGIARKLTKAQKAALTKLGRHVGVQWLCHFDGSYLGIRANTLNALVDLKLVAGRENYSSRHAGLLPLGIAVREALA